MIIVSTVSKNLEDILMVEFKPDPDPFSNRLGRNEQN